MSRFPRPVFANVPLHIIQRGNNRNPCFFARNDFQSYLDFLLESKQRFSCRIHAYVLMPNHIHLLATPDDIGAAAAMLKWLSQKYVQHINRKYRRVGTLWQGRYRSCLVDSEHYFMVCQRYIELNPVRAGLCTHPAEYDWSSYRANAYGYADARVTPHASYLDLAAEPDERRLRYRSLCTEGIPDNMISQVRAATASSLFFGSAAFTERMAAMFGRSAGRQRERG